MKPLNEYKTPECDLLESRLNLLGVHEIRLARDLERRLAACREALSKLIDMPDERSLEDFSHEELEAWTIARQTLAATKTP